MKRIFLTTLVLASYTYANDTGIVVPKGHELDDKPRSGRERICNGFLEEERQVNLEIELALREIDKIVPIDTLVKDMEANGLAVKLAEEGKEEDSALLTAISQVIIEKNPASLHLVSKLSLALEKSRDFKKKTRTCSLVADDFISRKSYERTNALENRLKQKSTDIALIAEFDSWVAEKTEEVDLALKEGRLTDVEALRKELVDAGALPWKAEDHSLLRRLEPHQKIHIETNSRMLLEMLERKSSTPKLDAVNVLLKEMALAKSKKEPSLGSIGTLETE